MGRIKDYTVECPNCHNTIHIPYLPRIKAQSDEETNLDLIEGQIETGYTSGNISLEEYSELMNEIDNWRDLITYEKVKVTLLLQGVIDG